MQRLHQKRLVGWLMVDFVAAATMAPQRPLTEIASFIQPGGAFDPFETSVNSCFRTTQFDSLPCALPSPVGRLTEMSQRPQSLPDLGRFPARVLPADAQELPLQLDRQL